ncbi:IS66 family transposase [Leisingera sp. S132]|uniref:IS66 family transposase n=1 Tax=Leisingera sp. S132 TaxID=2867016 RepID=UPI0021A2D6D2|nr:IS66 family transposase [Leisingera sp. S132]UWQ79079.1 IS66 family transposase [Leisingera sp. S132]
MKDIQTACAELARHPESYVAKLAAAIAEADRARELEPQDVITVKDARISTSLAEIKVLKANNRLLRAQLSKLQDMQFGQKSEKLPGNRKTGGKAAPANSASCFQAGMADGNAEIAQTEDVKPKPRGMLGRQAIEFPSHLPKDIRIVEPSDGAVCNCGCGMRLLGEQVIKRLTYKPAEIRVIEEHYPKYVCHVCDRFKQAPVPKRAFDQTCFDDRLIAGLAVSKFADFLPNFRQEQIFMRSGVKLHRSTMSRLMDQAVDALLPLYDVMNRDLKASSKLFMDETVLAQLAPGSGKTKTCYVWALCRDDRRWKGNAPPGVVFHFKQSRKGQHAEDILTGFNGALQVDGYAGYNRLRREQRNGGPLALAYCWAHVRRKFLDVHKATKSGQAMEVIELINAMYEIERRLKSQPASARCAARQLGTAPLMDKLAQLLQKISGRVSVKSTLGQAVTYTLKLWTGLSMFLSDGRIEIDSNAVENTIRPIALLRKNALFAGSEVGGRNWAVMASLIGTCKLNGVEPYAYLTWVFEQMAIGHPRSQYEKLLPWNCPRGRYSIEG